MIEKTCYERHSGQTRTEINKEYWNTNRHLQRVWLSSKVIEGLTKTKLYVGGRNNKTRKYILAMKTEDNNTTVSSDVCQIFFLRTLGDANANI